jgi:hypothetical protein
MNIKASKVSIVIKNTFEMYAYFSGVHLSTNVGIMV